MVGGLFLIRDPGVDVNVLDLRLRRQRITHIHMVKLLTVRVI